MRKLKRLNAKESELFLLWRWWVREKSAPKTQATSLTLGCLRAKIEMTRMELGAKAPLVDLGRRKFLRGRV